MMSVPVPFPGTAEEAQINFGSHMFIWDPDGDTRCGDCDCRPSYVAASYPCGAEVPRMEVAV